MYYVHVSSQKHREHTLCYTSLKKAMDAFNRLKDNLCTKLVEILVDVVNGEFYSGIKRAHEASWMDMVELYMR